MSSQPASWEPALRLPESLRRVVELSSQPAPWEPAPWLPVSFRHIFVPSSSSIIRPIAWSDSLFALAVALSCLSYYCYTFE